MDPRLRGDDGEGQGATEASRSDRGKRGRRTGTRMMVVSGRHQELGSNETDMGHAKSVVMVCRMAFSACRRGQERTGTIRDT